MLWRPRTKKLYALRDVTATVDKKELIAASILGKKLAEGIDCLVLDVKVGQRRVYEDRRGGARSGVADGAYRQGTQGKKVTALLTDMDVPLGNAAGNSLEVIEAGGETSGGRPRNYTLLADGSFRRACCFSRARALWTSVG